MLPNDGRITITLAPDIGTALALASTLPNGVKAARWISDLQLDGAVEAREIANQRLDLSDDFRGGGALERGDGIVRRHCATIREFRDEALPHERSADRTVPSEAWRRGPRRRVMVMLPQFGSITMTDGADPVFSPNARYDAFQFR
jgi:hypothetical protein